LIQVTTFLKPLAPDNFFSKTVFFRNIYLIKTGRDIEKKMYQIKLVGLQIFIFIKSSLFCFLVYIFNGFRDKMVQRIAKITTSKNEG